MGIENVEKLEIVLANALESYSSQFFGNPIEIETLLKIADEACFVVTHDWCDGAIAIVDDVFRNNLMAFVEAAYLDSEVDKVFGLSSVSDRGTLIEQFTGT